MDWTIRKFKKADIKHFLEWRKLVARRKKSREFWEWEYFKGPWGPVETWLADDGEKIVGQYSTQRYEVFYFGKKILASLAFDAGTHPKYRKQGIFVALGKRIFSEEGKQDILFSTGFPNNDALPGHMKVNWQQLCPIPLLQNRKIPEISIKNSTGYEVIKITKFDDTLKGFSENFKDSIPIYMNRTVKYLNWRFFEKPGINYPKYQVLDKSGEIVAYFVLKYYVEENHITLHLIDFLILENTDLYKTILYTLRAEAKEHKINKITMFLSKYHPFRQFLEKHGFRYADTNRVYIVHNNSDILDNKNLFIEKNHFFTMGDSDVF